MIVTPLALEGVRRLELELRGDNRGFFARSYCRDELRAAGVPFEIAQCNFSFNRDALTMRGLHFAAAPAAEGKIVRCTAGAVWDCLADLRPESPTYLKWIAEELTADNRFSLLIPPGVAHGFLSLRPGSEVLYLMSEAYRPDCAAGVRWNDPTLGIRWPDRPAVISDRDQALPLWKGPGRG
ncbi:MAG: dTDP-4-dehydrorhamnose 3,5-epimerase family protein [Kiritimatiellia bacterium]